MADKLDEEPKVDPEGKKEITDLLKKSQGLSKNIYQTEQEIQKLKGPKSLTLTQLADLHDKICLLTSDMVHKDTKSTICDQARGVPCPGVSKPDPNIFNKRIAALQKQIAEKQMEAGLKLQDLKRALRNEQANLIRISDQMNRERKRNLNLQLNMDDSP